MRHYQRLLAHWDIVGQPLFVSFRLHASLPAHRVFLPRGLALSGKAFVLLDRGAIGPSYLRRRGIAELVVGGPSRIGIIDFNATRCMHSS